MISTSERHPRRYRVPASVAMVSLALCAGLGRGAAAPAPLPFGLDAPLPAAGPAQNAAPAPAPLGAGPPAANVKHLPAGPRELAFRGEMTRRSYSVYLTRGEIDQTKVFQLAFKNAVAALPERSNIQVSVNGRALATISTRSPNAVTVVPVPIPRGVLQPGANKVDLSVTMAHRVDCSVGATYELWTEVDAAQTGFLVPPSDFAPMRSIEEVAGEALAEDGTFRIDLRASQLDGPAAFARAGRLVDALVRRAGIARPVVRVVTEPSKGPGLDVLFAVGRDRNQALQEVHGLQGARVLRRENGVTVARDPASGRLAIIVAGASTGDLDGQIAAFDAEPAAARPASAASFDGQGPKTFADLGLSSVAVVGRRYSATIPVEFPPDFFPTGHDRAQLSIDGAYAPDIEVGSDIAFRVNGKLVSSLNLTAGGSGALRHELVELPLRFFHPGHNEVAMDAVTTTAADRRCDVTATSNEIRLSLSDSSELEVPHLARLATSPTVPAALSDLAGEDGRTLHIYVADAGPSSVGSGLTVLANMVAAGPARPNPVFHVGPPAATDPIGLVVAPWTGLPASFSSRLQRGFATVGDAGAAVPPPVAPQPDGASPSPSAAGAPLAQGLDALRKAWDGAGGAFDRAGLHLTGVDLALRRWAGQAGHLLEQRGFFFGEREGVRPLPFTRRTLLVAAVDQGVPVDGGGSLDLPRFTAAPGQWLVVTASDEAVLRSGLDRVTADGRWNELQGEAVSFDLDKGTSAATQPRQVVYVLPDHLTLSDIRPILGGIVSDNVALSLVALMLLMSLLGASTYGLIRRAGVK